LLKTGKMIALRIAIMAITVRSSTRVKAATDFDTSGDFDDRALDVHTIFLFIVFVWIVDIASILFEAVLSEVFERG